MYVYVYIYMYVYVYVYNIVYGLNIVTVAQNGAPFGAR